MNPLIALFSSSLGKKFLMAASGAVLALFVLGHMAGNLQVFLDPYYINAYAYKLQHLPYGLLWVVRLVMLTTVVVHIWVSVVLTLENMKARPHDYKVKATVKASYASRTMRVSGVILFLFIVFHIAHFTVRNVPGHEYGEAIKVASGEVYAAEIVLKKPESQGGAALKTATGEDKIGHDVHTMIIAGFQIWWISAFYLLAVFLLSRHLSHGVSSMFQSLGLRNSGFRGALDLVAAAYGWVVFLGYASIPAGVLLGLVKVQGILIGG